ncbi:HAMP domain-containing histidine kinase [Paenibacillus polysaccharolyticus]|uniref:HAMP domain-containing sensor histidine kinase n=1 Tax=Paenibacillus polysaccharolyticus TaxID=582692 RepID=UPI00203EEE9A|nr:HAMP domain-containing sensor histidine kinase [Paenibacillus polysaccharolyticus]MCM3133001.1 HAMP domain-containing histidine kinase [Paenibacillus polysaccharolyticus]
MAHRKFTLTKKLALIILLAATVSGLVFLTMQKVTNGLIDRYLNSNAYYESESSKSIAKFSKYVEANHLSSTDRKAFGEWVKKENYIMLTIYKDQLLQYDSNYSAEDEYGYGIEEETLYAQKHSFSVKFSDGEGRVTVDGFFSSRYYDIAFTLELVSATLIFLLIVLLGIRRSLAYLRKIHEEIHILEGGELEYEMTIRGHDEIAMIAESIEELRKAFLDKLNAIEALQAESRSLVTEMSHDMRTPLTSLIMYLEFAKKERGEQRTEHSRYITNAYGKAIQLKKLSDNLFDYFLLDKEDETDLESIAVQEAIYDLISDQISILRQEHFKVRIIGELPQVYITVNLEQIGRVFDNILSNLLKYAEPKNEILITFNSNEESFEIQLSNTIKSAEVSPESTGLGEKIISRMMSLMQGQFIRNQDGVHYSVVLRFSKSRI